VAARWLLLCHRAAVLLVPRPLTKSGVEAGADIVELLDAHRRAMAGFDRVVHHVREDQWDGPTPCTEWSVRAVVNHLVAEQLWVPHLLRGETLADVGDRHEGDVLGADPIRVPGSGQRSTRASPLRHRARW
jgi:hypothetical protein